MITLDTLFDTLLEKIKTSQCTNEEFDKFLKDLKEKRQVLKDSKIPRLLKALAWNQGLTTVVLTTCLYADRLQKYLTIVLKQNKSLLSLNIATNNLGPAGAKIIAEALKENHTLTHLDLYGNVIGASGTKSLAYALEHNNTLTSLNLGVNELGTEGTRIIAGLLIKNRTLRKINLTSNRIDDAAATEFALALKGHNITHINLASNIIGFRGAKAILDGLIQNGNLISISFDNNPFDSETIKYISDLLKQDCNITELYLGWCNIDMAGAIKISEALTQNRRLRTLTLQRNPCGKGISEIINVLSHNQTLTDMDIGWNQFDDFEIGLLHNLKQNLAMRRMNVYGKTSNGFQEKVTSLLEYNDLIRAEMRLSLLKAFHPKNKGASILLKLGNPAIPGSFSRRFFRDIFIYISCSAKPYMPEPMKEKEPQSIKQEPLLTHFNTRFQSLVQALDAVDQSVDMLAPSVNTAAPSVKKRIERI